MTYGDGLADLDIRALIDFHRAHGLKGTVTGVQPPGRFGALEVADGSDRVKGFLEKPRGDGSWINGGFFVLSPEVGRYIAGDDTVWEQEPMRGLADDGQLATFRHTGFWLGMDTLRDRGVMEELWGSGRAPWRKW
jgi:glucose-1-phosphate cytidylyltransferase